MCPPDLAREKDDRNQNRQAPDQLGIEQGHMENIVPRPPAVAYRPPNVRDGAFDIMLRWLYGQTVKTPTTRESFKTLWDVYLLATKYKAHGLPDLIMDSVRQYCSRKRIGFNFLDHALKRHTLEVGQRQEQTEGRTPPPLNLPQDCRIIIYLIG